MPNEMTAEEAAKLLENMAKDREWLAIDSIKCRVLRYAASALRRVASGELAPVVHAHWKKADGWPGPAECSNCGADAPCDENGNERLTKRCPDCGALMGGKDGATDA